MFTMSWSTFRERWQLFVGSVLTVSVGVALVQASLLTLLAAVALEFRRRAGRQSPCHYAPGYDRDSPMCSAAPDSPCAAWHCARSTQPQPQYCAHVDFY